MSDYTPTEAEIVSAYVRDSASIIVKNGTVTNANVEKSHAEATRGIAKLKANTWDEAFEATCEAHDQWGGLNYEPTNPYRGDE